MTKNLSSWYFIATGAAGGVCGFVLLEQVAASQEVTVTASSELIRMAVYFGGFGVAVGAFLGMTEGLVRRRISRLVYGLVLGSLLGGAGGALGGALGQTLFRLLPIRYEGRSTADLAIVLDSSSSMKHLVFWGNDPWGKRQDAAQELIARLAPTARVTVIDFDHRATLLHPLTGLDSEASRDTAIRAVDRVDSIGGTSLTAGLGLAVDTLAGNLTEGRPRFVIFLTDGVGAFDPRVVERAREASIIIHTVGLGSGVDDLLLQHGIARPTGGEHFGVQRAGDLGALFERIYTERIAMTSRAARAPVAGADLITSPLLLLFFRIGSWTVMGLVIGLGQGVRENTREDLRACGLGGLVGGLVGGALFEPLSSLAGLTSGAMGRFCADVIVGASIGGSMRLAQERLVDALPKTTRLSLLLPRKEGSLGERRPEPFNQFRRSRVYKDSELRSRRVTASLLLGRRPTTSSWRTINGLHVQDGPDPAEHLGQGKRSAG